MYNSTLLEFLNMGSGEIILIMAVVLLLFGGKKLPELARGLGKGIRDFKDASEGVKREIHRNINSLELDEELKKEEEEDEKRRQAAAAAKAAAPSLEEQMYPNTATAEVIEKKENGTINLDKDAAPAVSTDIAATAEKLEKDKI